MPIDARRIAGVLIAAAGMATATMGATPAVAAAPAAPAAQVTDDVRCLLLSTGYARAATDEATRRSLTLTGAFFLGRLSTRLADPAVAAAIRAQGTGMRGAEAQPIMKACAARAAAAEQQLTAIARQAQATPR